MKKQRTHIKEKIADAVALPKDITLNLPKVTLYGSKEIYIENYKGIIEFSEEVVRVNTSVHIIKITGKNLILKNITDEEILFSGETSMLNLHIRRVKL